MKSTSSIAKLLNQLSLSKTDLAWGEDYKGIEPDWSILCQLLGKAHGTALDTMDPDRETHALHAYYLANPASSLNKIRYEIDEKRNGRAFNTRISKVVRDHESILTMFTSFHKQEIGPEHEILLTDISPPKEIPIRKKIPSPRNHKAKPNERNSTSGPSIIIRSSEKSDRSERDKIWTKWEEDLPKDRQVHQCLFSFLAGYYLFDWGFSSTPPNIVRASISVWFHQPCKVNEWLLWITDGNDKDGLQRTAIYLENGHLVASVAKQVS